MQDDDCEKITRLGDSRKRTRSAGTGTTGAERRNVRHVSAGEGMSLMASSMNVAADTLANAMREVATTLQPAEVDVGPPRQAGADANPNVTVAIALIESNKGLSDNEFSDAAQCITVNPMIATVYVCYARTGCSSRREVSSSGVSSGFFALATCDANMW